MCVSCPLTQVDKHVHLHTVVLHSHVTWTDMETGCSGRKKQPSLLPGNLGGR